MIYTMPDANTVQFKETWNGKDEEATTKSYDNRNFIGNVSIGMSYVNLILSFIENLA